QGHKYTRPALTTVPVVINFQRDLADGIPAVERSRPPRHRLRHRLHPPHRRRRHHRRHRYRHCHRHRRRRRRRRRCLPWELAISQGDGLTTVR
ncbi:hypothetical protein ALC60_02194, partial [Trachymyrmex zeteki]